MDRYQNPIIKGFNPDPASAGLVRISTWSRPPLVLPRVPIYHSRNLVEWELINYCLTEDSQLNLENCGCSKGIFAPTIRYHDGTFFMITTNVSHKGNFVVHTKDIRGRWSEPHWIDHVGIDPSLLFDDDGKVYYCGTALDEQGRQGIALFEINPFTGEKLSKTEMISYGTGGKYPEAPHLYKINGFYYLMIAEAEQSTIYGNHLPRRSPWGPYEPVRTIPYSPQRHQVSPSSYRPRRSGGRCLRQLVAGLLGDRPCPQHCFTTWEETFLAPVTWSEDGWPIIYCLEMEAEPGCPNWEGGLCGFHR